MNCWITTHWPRRVDESIAAPHAGVWVQDGKQGLIDRVAPLDPVFIYELKSGPAAIREYADGATGKIACRQGCGGIVALVEVTAKASEQDSRPEEQVVGQFKIGHQMARSERSARIAGR